MLHSSEGCDGVCGVRNVVRNVVVVGSCDCILSCECSRRGLVVE